MRYLVAAGLLCVLAAAALAPAHAEAPPPLKQLASGVPLGEIRCNGDMVPVQNGGRPACVTPHTAEKMLQRGWGHMPPAPGDVNADATDAAGSDDGVLHVPDAYARQSLIIDAIAAGHLGVEDRSLMYVKPFDVGIFDSYGRTYAAVIARSNDGLQLVDVTDPHAPVAAGRLAGDGLSQIRMPVDMDIFEDGDHTYAVVITKGRDNNGLQLVDVTDPHAPVAAGRLAGDERALFHVPYSVSTFGTDGRTYAVAIAHSGIYLADITDPHTPFLAGQIIHDGSVLLGSMHDVGIFETGDRIYAAAISSKGLQIIDVTDPHRPAAAGHLEYDSTQRIRPSDMDVFKTGDRTYVAITTAVRLQIIDVTDPHAPVAAGQIRNDVFLRSPSDMSIFETGGRIYAAVASNPGNSLQLVDITDPHRPAAAGQMTDDGSLMINTPYGTGVFEAGGRIYAAVASGGDIGLQLVDVTDPHAPAAAGNLGYGGLRLPSSPYSVDTFDADGRTYAAVTVYGGLQLVDVTDPHRPVPAGHPKDDTFMRLGTPSDIDVFETGGRTYVAAAFNFGNSIRIADVTDPHAPAAAGRLSDYGPLLLRGPIHLDVFTAGHKTYAAVTSTWDRGLQLVDVTDPHRPVPAGQMADDESVLLDYLRDVGTFETGGRTYAAIASHPGIQIADVTDPYRPVPAGQLKNDGAMLFDMSDVNIFEAEGRTYAAVTAYDGLQLVDVTDPHRPAAAGQLVHTGEPHQVHASGADIFESGGRTYAAVIYGSFDLIGEDNPHAAADPSCDDSFHIIDVTDPHHVASGQVIYDESTPLYGLSDVDVFESGGRTYAAVAHGGGLQTVKLEIGMPADEKSYDTAGMDAAPGTASEEGDRCVIAMAASGS